MNSWVVVVLVCLPLLALSQTQPSPPWAEFCGGRECPPYTLVDQPNTEFELRRYAGSTWVQATKGPSETRVSFWRLFRYISGKSNVGGVKIPMTVPVLKTQNPETMLFYIPSAFVPAPAVSANETLVSIRTVPAKEFFVRVFKTTSKRESEEGYAPNAQALRNDTANFITGQLYTAGYHSPWHSGERHNEVWLEKLSV